jgi:hypothetical protein
MTSGKNELIFREVSRAFVPRAFVPRGPFEITQGIILKGWIRYFQAAKEYVFYPSFDDETNLLSEDQIDTISQKLFELNKEIK